MRLAHLLPGHQGQADFRVGRTRDGAKLQRREQLDAMAELDQLARRVLQGPNHPVDLRFPRIGNDHDFHKISAIAQWRSAGCRGGWMGYGANRPIHAISRALLRACTLDDDSGGDCMTVQ